MYAQLQTAGMDLISCSEIQHKKSLNLGFGKKVSLRELIQFFAHMNQMYGAGIPVLEALSDIRDSSDNDYFRDVLSEVNRDVSEGESLSEAMDKHPKIFKSLYISLIKSGEDTGDLSMSYLQMVKYLTWVDEMRSKVKKATRYPVIVLGIVFVAVVVLMGFVVPQIVDFIKFLGQDIGFLTRSLIATSEFFSMYWWAILGTPVILFVVYKTLRFLSGDFSYRSDALKLKIPLIGDILRKIAIARYCQTFSSLFSSGVDVISSLKSARGTVTNRFLISALEGVEEYVAAGHPISDAFNSSGEFPSMVVRMVKVGEESGDLSTVLDQVSEYYTKEVDESVQGLITVIEPLLTAFLGGIIVWIAAGVFGPIYSNLGDLSG